MRLLIALIIMIVMAFPAFSEDIKAEGTGKTRAEALQNADDALAQRIALTTISRTKIIDADDGTDNVSYMLTTINSSYSTEFLGSKYEVEEQDGVYTATRIIPENSIRLYMDRIRDSVSIINNLYKAIERGGITYETYQRIYAQLREYERYSIIVSMLDDDMDIPSVPTNSADIEAMYQNALAVNLNKAQQSVNNLQTQRDVGIITQAGRSELERALKDLEKIEKEQERFRRMQEQEAQSDLKAFRISQSELVSKLSSIEINTTGSTSSSASSINQIEALMQAYNSAKRGIDTLFSNYENKYRRAVASAEKTIKDKDYLPFELDSRKRPTKSAIEVREQEAREAKAKLFNEYRENLMRDYWQALSTLIDISQKGQAAMRELSDSSYSISSPNPELSTRILGFDLGGNRWVGEAVLSIGTDSIRIPFYISLWAWLGIEPGEYDTYYAYREEVNELTNFFTTYPYAYLVDIEYSVKCYAGEKACRVVITSVDVHRRDNNVSVYSSENRLEEELPLSAYAEFVAYVPSSELLDTDSEYYQEDRISTLYNNYWNLDAEGETARKEAREKAAKKAEEARIEKQRRKEANEERERKILEEEERFKKSNLNGYIYLDGREKGSPEVSYALFFRDDLSFMKQLKLSYNFDFWSYRGALRPTADFIVMWEPKMSFGGAAGADFIFPLRERRGIMLSAKIGGIYQEGVAGINSLYAEIDLSYTTKMMFFSNKTGKNSMDWDLTAGVGCAYMFGRLWCTLNFAFGVALK